MDQIVVMGQRFLTPSPRIKSAWWRMITAVVTHVLIAGFGSAVVLSFLRLLQHMPTDLEAVAKLPPPTPEQLRELMQLPGSVFSLLLMAAVSSFLVTWIWSVVIDRRPLHSLTGRVARAEVLWAGAMAALLAAVAALAVAALSGRHVKWDGFQFVGVSWAIPFLVVIVLASVLEEWFVRGYIWKNLREIAGPMRTIFLTALVFAMLHARNPEASSLGTINIWLVGLCLGFLRELTGGTGVGMGFHVGWNLMLGMVLGASVSGVQVPSLFRIGTSDMGPAMGGGFGPEASVVTTILFMLANMALFYRHWASHHKENGID